MACLKVQGPNYQRLIPEDHDGNVRGVMPHETVIGAEMNCGPHDIDYDYESVITPAGFMIGNAIKKVTNAVGIKQCMSCKGRQRKYNDVGIEVQQKVKEFFWPVSNTD